MLCREQTERLNLQLETVFMKRTAKAFKKFHPNPAGMPQVFFKFMKYPR